MALLSSTMAWPQSQETFQRSHFVNNQICAPRPYSLPLTDLPVTSAMQFSLTEPSSAHFVTYVTPRYIPEQGYMLSPRDQDYHTFENYPWPIQPGTRLNQDDDYSHVLFTGNDGDGPAVEVDAEHTGLLEAGPVTYSNAITQTTPSAENGIGVGNIRMMTSLDMKTQPAECISSPLESPLSDRTGSSTESDQTLCRVEGCVDDFGRPKKFSRKADVLRHYKSQHQPTFVNCPRKNCSRKGEKGFTRGDHLTEHLRGFHMEDIPKKPVVKRAGGVGNTGNGIQPTDEVVVFEFREAKNWCRSTKVGQEVDKECMGLSGMEVVSEAKTAVPLQTGELRRQMKQNRMARRQQRRKDRGKVSLGNFGEDDQLGVMMKVDLHQNQSTSYNLPSVELRQAGQRAGSRCHVAGVHIPEIVVSGPSIGIDPPPTSLAFPRQGLQGQSTLQRERGNVAPFPMDLPE